MQTLEILFFFFWRLRQGLSQNERFDDMTVDHQENDEADYQADQQNFNSSFHNIRLLPFILHTFLYYSIQPAVPTILFDAGLHIL